tara:strand:- start:1390 stop:1974 length:585 start_codon:yes stop_codon:yes gene_type:complete
MCIFVAAAPGVVGGMTAATAAALNTALITAAATAASMSAANANAQAMADWQQTQADAQAEVAQADAISKYGALQDRSMEQEIAQGAALQDNRRKALEAQSISTVMAGEGGVKGSSVGLLLGDLERQNQDYQTAVLQQEKFREGQFIRESEAVSAGHTAALWNSTPGPIATPDYLGGLLGVAAAGYGTYNQVKYS